MTGYNVNAVASLAEDELGAQRMSGYGAVAVDHAVFGLAYSLTSPGA